MMIPSRREKVPPQGKQEANHADGGKGAAGVVENSRPWNGLRDPRMVRVARTLGGKDRHSKVSTIRGLRDRRVRLSVPTAVQLYDLQDRLGLNQPSKVVDWLLDASRHEIDRLPPLQIPPGCFLQCPPSMAAMAHANGAAAATSTPPPEDEEGEEEEEHPSGLPMAASLSMECGTTRRVSAGMVEKDGFFRRIGQEHQRVAAEPHTIPAHGGDHLHGQRQASMPGMLQGSSGEHNSSCSYHVEGPNQLGIPHLGCYPVPQGEELHGYRASATPVPSSMFSAYAAAAAAAAAAASAGYDHRHPNGFQMGLSSAAAQGFLLGYAPSSSLHSSSAGANMRPLQLSISSMHHESNTEQLL
ncbi:hypothetical protein Taro_001406 [Colocasia esculenta]|uniref:TCP domain-containing protein n=1 Tax=Colocasia esculenta TaxID=4460 RepID=A0A843TI33_COLES|nr:hypothetical protein [Colocasia esculenta]